MFKKPLDNLKTTAPLRASDRRKLRQRVADTYKLAPDVAELLVPDGLLSTKFVTHQLHPGIAYIAPGNPPDPLWFTIGKNSDDLIPTVYTLWKHPALLPALSTPSAVIPILIGGADLMIPGVVTLPTTPVQSNELVAVTQYVSGKRAPPLAVGRMAIDSSSISGSSDGDSGKKKGKAVLVIHSWKDCLWEMGGRTAPPKNEDDIPDTHVCAGEADVISSDTSRPPPPVGDSVNVQQSTLSGDQSSGAVSDSNSVVEPEIEVEDEGSADNVPPRPERAPSSHPPAAPLRPRLSPEDISAILHASLLQTLQVTPALSSKGSSTDANSNVGNTSVFPMAAATFWSNFILPARPASIDIALKILGRPEEDVAGGTSSDDVSDQFAVDIKHSSHKSLAAFFKAAEKQGLVTLKGKTQGGKSKSKNVQDALVITGVNTSHILVQGHHVYLSVAKDEQRRARAQAKSQASGENTGSGPGSITTAKEIRVTELWKPHLTSVAFFEKMGENPTTLYSIATLKQFLTDYISSNSLANAHELSYVDVARDPRGLGTLFSTGGSGQSGTKAKIKGTATAPTPPPEFVKREDLVKTLQGSMQDWYEIEWPAGWTGGGDDTDVADDREGKEKVVRKKGTLSPISISAKARGGGRANKSSTVVMGLEPFGVHPESLAEEMRRVCACSCSVSQLPNKPASAGLQVLIQGKQNKAVMEALRARGVPKKWINVVDV